jgi:hypothetical protein
MLAGNARGFAKRRYLRLTMKYKKFKKSSMRYRKLKEE